MKLPYQFISHPFSDLPSSKQIGTISIPFEAEIFAFFSLSHSLFSLSMYPNLAHWALLTFSGSRITELIIFPHFLSLSFMADDYIQRRENWSRRGAICTLNSYWNCIAFLSIHCCCCCWKYEIEIHSWMTHVATTVHVTQFHFGYKREATYENNWKLIFFSFSFRFP